MFDLQAIFSVASIAIGFVAAVCFCIGAATNVPKNIAISSATIVGANPAIMHSLSAQRAQYLVGALLLVASFGLQVGVVLTSKDAQVGLPLVLQSPLALLISTVLIAAVIAFLAISKLTTYTIQAANESLQRMKEEQAKRRS